MENHELMECPYNKSHLVPAIKMPYHVMKCRKNFPSTYLVVCPFDASHEVLKADLKNHMLHCPNRVLLERDTSIESLHTALTSTDVPLNKGYTGLPRYRDCTRDTSDDQEYWDTETNPRSLFINSRRTRGDSQRNTEYNLRWPISHGRAAELSTSAIPELSTSKTSDLSTSTISGSRQHSTASPQRLLNSDLMCLGRGRARPALATNFSPGHLRPDVLPSASMIRPGLPNAATSLGRGLILLPTSKT